MEGITGFRLINSRFPPISLFDDVADEGEFDALYELQALTNPRLQTELGNLNLIDKAEIPFGIPGCSYATGPFTHVNPEGSRFSDGQYGVLYMGDSIDTAITEVAYHQSRYWQGVHGLDYDRLVFRGLKCKVGAMAIHDATTIDFGDPIYDPHSYGTSRVFGRKLYQAGSEGLQYHSVRKPGATCWGLFTPRHVRSIIQSAHFEFIWNGQEISSVNKFTRA
ncbi:RES family NAD+ phosphorylase [Marinobacter sp. 71-i]|uniref:RES family NAD+ phosphorylase n=1 Tax=Marinobacter iranensis TaxID=2962607 RepID=A0ABT5Y947_9GAMM|nr:RES family NAD+ phosphorylase [Marinobacter iranensis]MDF0750188.1 RES family NAD+ phosphorylase [Marinobacter iranensis]